MSRNAGPAARPKESSSSRVWATPFQNLPTSSGVHSRRLTTLRQPPRNEVVAAFVRHRSLNLAESKHPKEKRHLFHRVDLVDVRADRIEPDVGVTLTLELLCDFRLLRERHVARRLSQRVQLMVVLVVKDVVAARFEIHHQVEQAAGLDMPGDVLERLSGIDGLMDDAVAPDEVVVSREGQRFEDVVLCEAYVRELRAIPPRSSEPAIGHVERIDLGSEPPESPSVAPGAAAGVEDLLAAEPFRIDVQPSSNVSRAAFPTGGVRQELLVIGQLLPLEVKSPQLVVPDAADHLALGHELTHHGL